MKILTGLSLLVATSSLAAAELHVLCDGDALGSMVFVNEQYHGNCPLSVTLPADRHAVRVQQLQQDGTRKIFQAPVDLRHLATETLQVQLSAPEPYRLALTPVPGEPEDQTLQPVLQAALNHDSDAIVALYEYYGGANGFTPQPEKQRAWHIPYLSTQWLRLAELRHFAAQGNFAAIDQLIQLLGTMKEEEYFAEQAFWQAREQALNRHYHQQHERYRQYLQGKQKRPWLWPAPVLFESRQSTLVKVVAGIPAVILGVVATPVVAIQRSSNALRYHDVKDGPAHWPLPEALRGDFQQSK